MARKRPTVLTVMGILNIVFGSFGLACGLCAGIGLLVLFGGGAFGGAFQGQKNPFNEVNQQMNGLKAEVPSYAAVQVGQVVIGLVNAVLLLIAGIGLLKVQNWARLLSMVYSIIGILLALGNLVYALAIVIPAQARLMPRQQIGDTSAFSNVMAVATAIFSMAYPIILLIMMMLPSVVAACAGRPPREDFDQDREDEDDLGRERRPPEEWRE